MFEIQGLQQLNDSVAKLIEHDALIQAIEGVGAIRGHDEDILETAQTANALAQKALETSQVANDMASQSLSAMLDSNIIAVVAVCVSCFVALFTLGASAYIYYRQEKIIKKQLSVAEAQNRITLFEKRFYYYQIYAQFIYNINMLLTIETEKLYPYSIVTYREKVLCTLVKKNLFSTEEAQLAQNDSNPRRKLFEITREIQLMKYVFDFTEHDVQMIKKLKDCLDTALEYPQGDSETEKIEKYRDKIVSFIEQSKTLSINDILKEQLFIITKDSACRH